MRDNVIKRVYGQRSGYWKPDGEGIEDFAATEWAAALNLLAGGEEQAFVRSATTLLAQGDSALAHKLAELGLLAYPSSSGLSALRRQALDRLRELYQQLNPFKFIVYSGWAGADLPPLAAGRPLRARRDHGCVRCSARRGLGGRGDGEGALGARDRGHSWWPAPDTVPGRAGRHHRRDGDAEHRRRAGRLRPLHVDHHGVPADQHRGGSDCWQTRGPVRPSAVPAWWNALLSRDLALVQRGRQHRAAGRLSRAPGCGRRIITAAVFAAVPTLFSATGRARIVGLFTATYGLASIVGPLLGGAITDTSAGEASLLSICPSAS